MGSGQGLPTHYPHSLAPCPSCGPAELGPGAPTPPETGTQPRPPRSLAPTRTQPTHITVVRPAHLPHFLPSPHFHSPSPKLGSQTWQNPALWERTVATVLCPCCRARDGVDRFTVWSSQIHCMLSLWGPCSSETRVSMPYLSSSHPRHPNGVT